MKIGINEKTSPPTLATPITRHDHMRGPINAPMKLVEYGDYECPYCGGAFVVVKALERTLENRLCFVYRHFPLTHLHPHAEHAAEAAEAAGAQGHFWEMHDILFENQAALEDEDLARYAGILGLDVPRFIHEVRAETYIQRVRENVKSGHESQVPGTPSFFINGLRYDGPDDFDTLLTVLVESTEGRV